MFVWTVSRYLMGIYIANEYLHNIYLELASQRLPRPELPGLPLRGRCMQFSTGERVHCGLFRLKRKVELYMVSRLKT